MLRDTRLRALADSPGAFGSTHAGESARPDSFWQERAAAAAAGLDRVGLIAESPTGWVGMVSGFEEREDPARSWLVGMWVDPAWRGRGVGRALVDEVIAWARTRGTRRLWLEVAITNLAAIRLYQRCGFVATGDTLAMERDPSIIESLMALQLSDPA